MKGISLIVCAWLLGAAVPAYAHLLNMTEMHLQTAEDGSTTLRVRIDLGQSLLTAEDYWRAASAADRGEQRQMIETAISALQSGIEVAVGKHAATLAVRDWKLEAVSLEAIRNPLTPQMAELTFDVMAPAAALVEVRLSDTLQVPWPCLLRVDVSGLELPISRLLTDDSRMSRPIDLTGDQNLGHDSWLVEATSAFQLAVPTITWVAVGFAHIIPLGLDHIVFILGLFFLSSRLSTLMWQVSCFTLAHSLTLGLATAGIVQVSAGLVEPLIAASIVYVAVDNLYGERLARWRLFVVTLFGLLHGLGFASALHSLRMPEESFLMSLLMFNLGVELGQLAVLAVAFAVVGWLRRRASYQARVAQPASVTIAGVGLYWLVRRLAF